mgnify:CR=1 FL=1
MPCIWGTHNRSQLFLSIAVFPPNLQGAPTNITAFKALIDTGAQSTCISSTVAQAVGLRPLGKKTISGVSGVAAHNYYSFHIGFMQIGLAGPNNTAQGNLAILDPPIDGVELAISGQGFDVLLGMDVIAIGSLAVEGNGTFSFSY